ncbi:Glycosyl transferases group 1 [Rubripirellula tenax]|uniref:Glycosyl transferases group 1 n=2 Tax=Rubripirellula tenax TaxID=2528015 RepID=A0A5C6F296_9BACT|nr:Glycosyl transferases group 1 [Rubripirellula tenax]
MIRPEDVFKARVKSVLRPGRKRENFDSTAGPLDGSKATEIVPKSDASDPRYFKSVVSGMRQKSSELLFAIPDNRIAWKKDAVDRGLQIVRENNCRLVYATAPPFSSLLVGREIAMRAGLPLVIDFRDPWTRVPWGPRNKSWLANRWVARLEKKCVTDASAVVLNTPELENDFVTHYSQQPREKFSSIPNGFDPEIKLRIDSYTESRSSAEESGATGSTVQESGGAMRLLHPGSVYRNRDPRPIIDAIAKLHRSGLSVFLEQIGFCDDNFDLKNYAIEKGVGDLVEVKPAVPHDEMLRRMAKVDGFVLLQPGTALQVPGKLFEMLLFRKPILAICVPGAVSSIVQRYQIGTIAEAGNVDQIANAIRQISKGNSLPSLWDEAQKRFDGQQLTKEMASVFDCVSNAAEGLSDL